MRKQLIFFSLLLFICSCEHEKKRTSPLQTSLESSAIVYAKGFSIEKKVPGLTIVKILSPWPNADTSFTYALISKAQQASITLNRNEYDAIVSVPVENVVVTSTTHIPALESLGVLDKLIGFPDTQYISSKKARKLVDSGHIIALGVNENLNTEAVIALQPELVVGFAVNGENSAYETLERSQIPLVYNGDWVEETPLGKAEWIKFFAPFFEKETEATAIFKEIEESYLNAKALAATSTNRPSVLSGALYKDVWYLPGGQSWAANFFKDANANYLWKKTTSGGSLSLSWESVLDVAQNADFWIGPAQFSTYAEMEASSKHYLQFDAFQKKKIYTFANTIGETGGTLYYELAPQRPDLVLQDLIFILHPGVLPDHEPFFFKPLD